MEPQVAIGKPFECHWLCQCLVQCEDFRCATTFFTVALAKPVAHKQGPPLHSIGRCHHADSFSCHMCSCVNGNAVFMFRLRPERTPTRSKKWWAGAVACPTLHSA